MHAKQQHSDLWLVWMLDFVAIDDTLDYVTA